MKIVNLLKKYPMQVCMSSKFAEGKEKKKRINPTVSASREEKIQ